jgi:hypothetical protein
MDNCSPADDALDAFVECLQSDRGPIKLDTCEINTRILANALEGKSRVTRLEPASGLTNDAEAVLFRALANNRGLGNLNMQNHSISDENWTILCQSLQAHPTLTSLNLIGTWPRSPADDWRRPRSSISLSAEQKTLRTRLLRDIMQTNKVLQTIDLHVSERAEHI